ncbi:MAG: DUF6359 domain-containing protein [Pseudoflavonifractor sp.]|nr:DUF6359 domain-containing protein [Alloprevotella sp.]MCM1116949.1 DUF6359 domain-containing protein [Pseudoflavonifractor sp.]
MKKIFRYAIAALTLLPVGLWTASCQDDVDSPAMVTPESPLAPNTTIAELKEAYWNDAANYIDTVALNGAGEHIIISGRVTSSDEAGNIYKSLVIQDATGALAMSINANSLFNRYRIGQEVVVDVTDMYIGKYSSLQQLGFPDYSSSYGWQATFMPYEFFEQHASLNGLPEPEMIDTINVTIPSLSNTAEGLRMMQSRLIRINNVHFEEGGQANFCSAHKVNTNRTLLDENGNSIIVRTSGYARFWSSPLPVGNFDIVGILSYNGSGSSASWQLLLRSLDDVLNVGNPTLPIGTETNPYTVEQAVGMEAAGNAGFGWVQGYIVGALRAGVSAVTSVDDIQWEAPFEMNNTLVIGQSPSSHALTEALVVRLPQGSAFRAVGNLRDNPSNLGHKIMVYGNFTRDLGTFGITGNKGTAAEFSIEGIETPGSGIPQGDGTEAKPFNPAQVCGLNPSSTSAAVKSGVWVKGYVVGWVNTDLLTYADTESCIFTVPASKATNLLLAGSPDVTDFNECISVNLPTGSGRSALNLVDNPSLLGKAIAVKGDVMKYVGIPGVKNITEYDKGQGGGDTPTPPSTTDPLSSLTQDFSGLTDISQLKGWTLATPSGNRPWFIQSYNSNTFAACTGYNGKPGAQGFDSWLITPALDVDKMASKVMSFTTCVGYSGSGVLEVYAMTTADPTTAILTRLNASIPRPTGSWSEFIPSGAIDLNAFKGVIFIGFRYYGEEASGYTTYRIDDLKIGEGSSTPSTPDNPDAPGDGSGTEASPYTVAQAITLYGKGGATDVYVSGYIVGSVDGQSIQSGAHFSTEAASATNILLASSASETDIDKCIPVQLPSGVVRSALNLAANPANLGKKVTLKGNIEKYFGVAGLKSTSTYKF